MSEIDKNPRLSRQCSVLPRQESRSAPCAAFAALPPSLHLHSAALQKHISIAHALAEHDVACPMPTLRRQLVYIPPTVFSNSIYDAGVFLLSGIGVGEYVGHLSGSSSV